MSVRPDNQRTAVDDVEDARNLITEAYLGHYVLINGRPVPMLQRLA
jgi:hypothetical protein